MSLLYRVVFAAACKNTHHRLVLDALRHVRDPRADVWRDLFLFYYETLLKGAKAPDDEFKDFVNHVLHVRDNYWGGAVKSAQLWYKLALDALRNQDWKEAVYSAGVLSHYFTDPFMPLHTAQSESEGKVHRPAEWSVAQSYVELQNIIEQDLGGYPHVEVPATTTWLADLMRYGAEEATKHYETILEHYNLSAGVKDPLKGLDQELKDRIAGQIALAAGSFASVLDRLWAEAKVEPPQKSLTVETFVSTAIVPIFWITKKLTDVKDKAAVMAIYDEVQRTGKVVQTLPEDERVVRRLHAEQVLKKPMKELDAEKPKSTGTEYGKGASPRTRSNRARIVKLPSLFALPAMPRMRMPTVRVPSFAAMKSAAGKMHMPKLSKPSIGMPSMAGATSGAKAALAKLGKLPKWRKTKTAEAEAGVAPEAETAKVKKPAESILRRTPPTTDLDAPRTSTQTPSATIRRTDPPGETPPKPSDARREGTGTQRKFYLEIGSRIEDAPSIGPKLARRLEAIDIHTVSDLLECDPRQTAPLLKASFIDAALVARWQKEAEFVCRVPRLRGHDAQILVGSGVDDVEDLLGRKAAPLLEEIEEFLTTQAGEKILRGNARPDLAEVEQWLEQAHDARPLLTA
ncbi:MAG: DUF4332 domain-containing protein [Planctomycetia bacterium]|nr:DUF4332 domain-containing protein [Planctomycetia bacterium]